MTYSNIIMTNVIQLNMVQWLSIILSREWVSTKSTWTVCDVWTDLDLVLMCCWCLLRWRKIQTVFSLYRSTFFWFDSVKWTNGRETQLLTANYCVLFGARVSLLRCEYFDIHITTLIKLHNRLVLMLIGQYRVPAMQNYIVYYSTAHTEDIH